MTTTTTSDPPEEDLTIEAVLVDPSDGSQLRARVSCAVEPAGDQQLLQVVETDAEVTLTLATDRVDPPCLRMLVSVRLGAPLGGRRVIDGHSGAQVQVQDEAPRSPERVVPAECTSAAARRAVELDVDAGLRAEMLTCDGAWMTVATSSNACAPTGEEQDASSGCIGNEHVGYWRNHEGVWVLIAFDDCEQIRRQYEDFGDANCAR